jgi:hypothetical protein
VKRPEVDPVEEIIERIVEEDTRLVEEARRLGQIEDVDELLALTPRELMLRDAARRGAANVPWFLAEAAANSKLVVKGMMDARYGGQVGPKSPIMLIVAPQTQVEEWAKRAAAIQAEHEQLRRLDAIEAKDRGGKS